MPPKLKVLAYVWELRNGEPHVLVFTQAGAPAVGIQVPGGSVDPGEQPEEAVVREVHEEVGVSGARVGRCLGQGSFEWQGRQQLRHFFELAPPPGLPEHWSHTVTAGEDDTGLLLQCFWLPLKEAAVRLINDQGMLLHLLECAAPPGGDGS